MVLALASVSPRLTRHDSYLYPGFRAAAFLPSIQRQRQLQALVLDALPIRSVVFAGCGFGDEMSYLLDNTLPDAGKIVAIDIADVADDIVKVARRVRKRVSFCECDLLDLEVVHGSSSFDLVQAGFVFHDLPGEEKDEGFAVAARALNNGGYLLVSDFFPSTELSADELYEPFIEEADAEVREGRMPALARGEFLGDGQKPGLLRTITEAAAGDRDFFECADSAVARSRPHGLRLIGTRVNELNNTMRVLLFQKVSREYTDVLSAI